MIKKFIVNAKINTYAAEGEGNEIKLSDGGRELRYEEGNFSYRDRYYGYNPFLGEEIVWENNKPVWGMNYCGRVFENEAAKFIYDFLKEALKLIPEETPFRGPKEFKKGELTYYNKWSIETDSFKGEEFIFFRGKKVYELFYQGFVMSN